MEITTWDSHVNIAIMQISKAPAEMSGLLAFEEKKE
jgi:hypothetical protein